MVKRLFIILVILFTCMSCARMDEMQGEIDNIKDRLDNVEAQLRALKSAYDDGKIITGVKAFSDENNSGWTITFSDNSEITIYNGNDAITPIMNITPDGYWAVSYDNGETFTTLTDSEGNYFQSQGEEGISVRIVTNEEGYYVIELYKESDPTTVISSIETTLSANLAVNIVSMVKDPITGIITMEMADGTVYEFNMSVVYPTSVVVLAEDVFLGKDRVAKVVFRVNPSNAVISLDQTAETPMVQLDMVIENASRSYVTDPKNYTIEKIEVDKDAEGKIKEGQYIAHIKDLGNDVDFCNGVAFVINTKDSNGAAIQITSNIFKMISPDKPSITSFSINDSYAAKLDAEFITVKLPYGTDVTRLKPDFEVTEGTVSVNGQVVEPGVTEVDFSRPVEFVVTTDLGGVRSYTVTISYSELPVVYINTKDSAPIVSKDDWMKNTDMWITNAGEYDMYYEKAQIRGRGNSTWEYPKKPYAIKLDKKAEVLGMPKHKRWVLLANYIDKTCIRNSIAFELARRMEGLDWTPRGTHVDVVLNGQFIGNYYLCEQIKVDENRVNITEMESTDNDPESITGGYLLEIDKNYDEVNKFLSYNDIGGGTGPNGLTLLPFMVKEPDEDVLNATQLEYIKNLIEDIRVALYEPGWTTEGYLKYIDLDSFIDYWFVCDMTGNPEPIQPKSVYMYKDRGEKIHAGPVWDFDYFTFNPYYQTNLLNRYSVWNSRIIMDPANSPQIKQRWNAQRESIRSILDEFDRQYQAIKESVEYNAKMWPIPSDLNVNQENELSIEEAIARMKEVYERKFNHMDRYINSR